MKQGRATSSKAAATPVNRPKSMAVPPAYPASLGNMKGNHATGTGRTLPNPKVPMHEGRGAAAPTVGRATHKSGSQGKH
jgi:hypothetical protein